MYSKKLLTAEATLSAKFEGTFSLRGGHGKVICKLYKNGKSEIESRLVLENEVVEYISKGIWDYADEEVDISVVNEADETENYVAKPYEKTSPQKKTNNLPLILALSIGAPLLVGGGIITFILIRKKRRK